MADGCADDAGVAARDARARLAAAGIDRSGARCAADRRAFFRRPSRTRRHRRAGPDRRGRQRLAGSMHALQRRAWPASRCIAFSAGANFTACDLALSPETLEPRPDTETLVDAVLPLRAATAARRVAAAFSTLAPAPARSRWRCSAQVAGAARHGADISARRAGDRGTAMRAPTGLGGRFSCSTPTGLTMLPADFMSSSSNPPYIRTQAPSADLQPRSGIHDPRKALDGGDDGLEAYRRIIAAEASGVSRELTAGSPSRSVTSSAATLQAIFAEAGYAAVSDGVSRSWRKRQGADVSR